MNTNSAAGKNSDNSLVLQASSPNNAESLIECPLEEIPAEVPADVPAEEP